MKNRYKYIVVILVYRNTRDLEECIQSIYKNINNCKIIVVNAYYDDLSKDKIKEIAKSYDCDFLNEENKGYSFGNNRGIEFANIKYEYDYIIISNPDIVLKQFNDNMPDAEVIAPKIVNALGKNQNPMVIKENKFAEYLVYQGLKRDRKLLFIAGIAMGKISNKSTLLFNKKHALKNIFIAHGSFVIIRKDVIDKIGMLYDENIFLFAEEGVLAYRTREHGMKTVYDETIVVYHKEDGCMKLADFSINKELKKANIYFYENYIQK